MIDYNYYTTLSDSELAKIISHVKNIQHQRLNSFISLFLSADIKKIEPLLDSIHKDKLTNCFSEFSQKFHPSDKNIDFYIFLKKHPATKNIPGVFRDIEEALVWRYPQPPILEKIKQELPETFEEFRKKEFNLFDEDTISYLHQNNMIDFDSLFKDTRYVPHPSLVSYVIKNNMFDNIEQFPFNICFPHLNEYSLSLVRSHFKLDLIDFKKVYYECSELHMKPYMKQMFKYKSPSFLDNFIIDEFFVREFSSTIDKISDNKQHMDFITKLFSLIQEKEHSVQDSFIQMLKSNVKKPKNKELVDKIEMNFNLNQSLPIKNSHSFKKL